MTAPEPLGPEDALYALLPAIHRLRDGEAGEPLRALLAAIGREYRVVAEDIDQLLDDQFIETCAPWAVPFIGDLIGYQPLAQPPGAEGLARAEVAQLVALRRAKGTVSAIEAAARAATGWSARAAEPFRTLARTEYMNLPRHTGPATADLRDEAALDEAGGAFDALPRTVDVRRVESRRGRHNLDQVAVFLWPLRAFALTASPAVPAAPGDPRRFRFDPLGADRPLWSRPLAERDLAQLAGPLNVPRPIRSAALARDLAAPVPRLYGAAADGAPLGIALRLDGADVPAARIRAGSLPDDGGGGWSGMPGGDCIVIDPERGRVALPPPAPGAPPPDLLVTCHHGFTAPIGGGEYPRDPVRPAPDGRVFRVPADAPSIAAVLAHPDWTGNGVIELSGSGRYAAPAAIAVAANGLVAIRSEPGRRALLVLAATALASVALSHTTLVPGRALLPDGSPADPGEPSLRIEAPLAVTLDSSITGAIALDRLATLSATDSIIDANALSNPALHGGGGPSGALSLERCTVIGRIHAEAFGLVSDCLLLAEPAPPLAPVHAVRRQEGCVRYSWLPPGSRTPRRFRCLPGPDGAPAATTRTLRFGAAAYARIDGRADAALLRAASDGGEPGAFASAGETRRLDNLAIRLAEQVPAGAAAGVFPIIEGD